MCGIAGIFSIHHSEQNRRLVEQIVASQYHRGPDFQAVETIPGTRAQVILGHNRLCIIDLSAHANQPMWDRERLCCIVFNGEIYNYIELKAELSALGHEFVTASDTEVILEAFKEWGTCAIERFNGMFALALYDATSHRLLLARDRFGVKPLYYYLDRDRLVFASTGRVIAERMGLEPNLSYVARGLRYGIHDAEDIAPYTGLKALKPGHCLDVALSSTDRLAANLIPYYNLASRVQGMVDRLASRPISLLASETADLLENAVDVRFRADVPVAISLSGGLDSSSVAALSVLRDRGDVAGYTFGHPEDARTEGPLTEQLSKRTGIRIHYIYPDIQEIIASFLEALEAQDAPFPGGSVMAQYLVYKEVHNCGVRVLLGGQGGDELFMGYRKYQVFRLRSLVRQRQYGQALAFCLSLVPMVLAELPQAGIYWRERHRYTTAPGVGTPLTLPPAEPMPLGSDPNEPLWKRQAQDVLLTSLPTLLRYEDRNSMAHSVESRLPFMDYRLVEFALALPTSVKLRGGFGKWIVREVVKGKVPNAIRRARYKRGFDVRQNAWIEQGLGAAIREPLRMREAKIKPWLAAGTSPDTQFSDQGLQQRPTAFCEATSLLWLADRTR